MRPKDAGGPDGEVPVLMVRHGRTEWNEWGRIQGHTDIPLSEVGRARLRAAQIPVAYGEFAWQSSPLRRAVESATLLGATDLEVDARLMEMHWGDWEGETRAELRERLGARMARMEERGVDFRPSGGESPRELMHRLNEWLRDVCSGDRGVIAVTHKGVIRAALALATGWDLRGSAPVRLDWERAHLFAFRAGRLQIEAMNVALHPKHAGARDPGSAGLRKGAEVRDRLAGSPSACDVS